LLAQKLPVEIIGPAPNFYARKGKYYYYQLVIKSKNRAHLQKLARLAPKDWTIDLDPTNLL
jgi:primosomal protein N'